MQPGLRLLVVLLLLTGILIAPVALARTAQTPTLRVGLIASQSGSLAATGADQVLAAETFESRQRIAGLRSALSVEYFVADDASSPQQAGAEARRLVQDEDVHVLICCTSAAATAEVMHVAEELGVPLLALSGTDDIRRDGLYWALGMAPDSRKIVQAIVLDVADRGSRIALMAVDDRHGEQAARALDILLEPGGVELAAEERFADGETVLTPSALWVATRQPAGVIVWGRMRDTVRAVDALRRRGYEGPIYIDPALLEEAGPLDRMALDPTYVIVSPARFALRLAANEPTAEQARRFALALRAAGANNPGPEAAYAWDAAKVLREGLEQALALGLDLSDDRRFRQVLRDSLLSMGQSRGAAGTYDFRERDLVGIEAHSLIVARLTRAGLALPARRD